MPLLRTVVIDPGHGGFDPGTHGLITKEKDIALAISLQSSHNLLGDMAIFVTVRPRSIYLYEQ